MILEFFGVILLFLFLFVILTYNHLVSMREAIKNAERQIDVQLKRRADLIPNLVETVKGYMKHEKTVLTEIAKLRSALLTGSIAERMKASRKLSSFLTRLFAVAERYPELKANQNFLLLQEELTNTENKIAYVRTAYNDYVFQYNKEIKQFPTNIIASLFGFKEAGYLKIEEEAKKPVKVKF